jgi:nitrite reductase/ring-hydroxylating ferredoxin subunit
MIRERKICALHEIVDKKARGFDLGGGDWPFRGLLFRDGDKVFAYTNVCAHQGHPLNLDQDDFMTADGKHLRCMSHGALFEPGTGLCVAGPCIGKGLSALPVRVEDEVVYVTTPESARELHKDC